MNIRWLFISVGSYPDIAILCSIELFLWIISIDSCNRKQHSMYMNEHEMGRTRRYLHDAPIARHPSSLFPGDGFDAPRSSRLSSTIGRNSHRSHKFDGDFWSPRQSRLPVFKFPDLGWATGHFSLHDQFAKITPKLGMTHNGPRFSYNSALQVSCMLVPLYLRDDTCHIFISEQCNITGKYGRDISSGIRLYLVLWTMIKV